MRVSTPLKRFPLPLWEGIKGRGTELLHLELLKGLLRALQGVHVVVPME